MKKFLIRKCNKDDSSTILKIFNESISKGLTGTRKKIKYSSHQKWFNQKMQSTRDFIFVGELNYEIVGYVRFDKIYYNRCEVSIGLKNKFINKGFGSKILKRGISKLKKIINIKSIKSKVKKGNINSINFFIKNNFKEIIYKGKNRENYRYFKIYVT